MAKKRAKEKPAAKPVTVAERVAIEGWAVECDHVSELERIREQLEDLAVDVEQASAPQTPAQWAGCLREIRAGADWRNRTWK